MTYFTLNDNQIQRLIFVVKYPTILPTMYFPCIWCTPAL